MEVHKKLGAGFLEAVYQEALEKEIIKKEILRVKKMHELHKAIRTVDRYSLLNCAKSNGISKWLRSVGEIDLADKCLVVEHEHSDEGSLRKQLINILEDYTYSINQAMITGFSRKNGIFSFKHSITFSVWTSAGVHIHIASGLVFLIISFRLSI